MVCLWVLLLIVWMIFKKLIIGLRQRSSPIRWSVELFPFDSLLIAARKFGELVALRGKQRLRQLGKNGHQQANPDENTEHDENLAQVGFGREVAVADGCQGHDTKIQAVQPASAFHRMVEDRPKRQHAAGQQRQELKRRVLPGVTDGSPKLPDCQ